MIDLEEKDLDALKKIISDNINNCRVYIFGSRVKNTSWKYSDIDLLVAGEKSITPAERMNLNEAFDESDITVRVDIVDIHELSSEFRQLVEKEAVLLVEL